MNDDDPLADAFNEGLDQRPPKPPSDRGVWIVWGLFVGLCGVLVAYRLL